MPENEGVLTMVLVQGMFIIGRMTGGNKLTKPRSFAIIDDPKDKRTDAEIMADVERIGQQAERKKLFSMVPLPGMPPWMRIGLDACSYPMPQHPAIVELYNRVTDPKVDPGG